MKKIISFFLSIFVVLSIDLSAERGLVTLYRQSDGDCLLVTLVHLQDSLQETLPIEIWYGENEMAPEHFEAFSDLASVTLRKMPPHTKQNVLSTLKGSSFTEIIWFDPSAIFVIRPSIIFDDYHYQETGAYLFKRLELLPRINRKNWERKNRVILKEMAHLLNPAIDQLPHYLKSKIFYKSQAFLAKYDIVFTDPQCFYLNRERHEVGLRKAIEISEQEFFSSLNATDCLWLGMITSEEDFFLNYVKQVELHKTVRNKESIPVAEVHLYKGKALFLEDFVPKVGEIYELVEPISMAVRPLIGYETILIPEIVKAYSPLNPI